MAKLKDAAGNNGLFTDGDWILSENLNNAGTIGVIQLKHVGIGEFLNKEFSFVSSDTFKELKCTEVKQNDILISRMADPIARACIVPKLPFKTVTAVDVSILRVDENVADTKYVQFLCNSEVVKKQAEGVGRGTTRQRITRKELELIEIPLPKPDEQKRIAAILDKADRLRRQYRFAQTLSDSFLESVFIKMFGDPVSNPMKWKTDSLDNLSQKITDGEHLNPNFATNGYPMVMAQHVDNNSVNLNNCRLVSSEDYLKFSKKCNPERGDVLLVSRGATIGRTCVVNTERRFCMMGSVILIKPIKTSVNADFINQLFKTTSYQKSLRRTSGSSAQEAIYIANLRNGKIIKPPLPLQENFAGIVQEYERIRRQQHEATRQAGHLFQTLLHRAFRGEL